MSYEFLLKVSLQRSCLLPYPCKNFEQICSKTFQGLDVSPVPFEWCDKGTKVKLSNTNLCEIDAVHL